MSPPVTTVTVSDLFRARAFYEVLLGFQVVVEDRPAGRISYDFGSSFSLAVCERVGYVRSESDDEIAVPCADIVLMWKRVQSSVTVVQPLGKRDRGPEGFVIRDPDGIRLRFEARPRPAGTRFDMIGVFVDNLGIMVAFYRDVLGLTIDWKGDGTYAEFEHEGIRFSMYARSELPQLLGQVPEFPTKLNGSFELAINVGSRDQVDLKFQEILQNGGREIYAPRDEPWKLRSAMLADPEGNLLEIASDFWM